MNDISGAALEDPNSTIHHTECSFVVHVKLSCGGEGLNCVQSTKWVNDDAEQTCADPESIAYGFDMQDTSLAPQPYHLQASSIAERDQWITEINTALRAYQRERAEKARQGGSALRMCQLRLRSFYTGLLFQTSTALLVAVNFFVTVSAAMSSGCDTPECGFTPPSPAMITL